MAVMGRVADLVVHTSGQLDTGDARQNPQHVVEPVAARGKSVESRPREDGPFVVEPVASAHEPRSASSGPRKASEERPARVAETQGSPAR
jgi:hypothetical protein